MVWRWILCVLVLLIALLCRTRVGALVTLGDAVTVDVKVGLFRFRAVPGRPKKKKPQKPEPDAGEGTEKKSPLPKPGLEDVRDAARTLLPPLRRALRRTRRGIRIAPLRLSLALGGQEDPAAAAKLYGELNAGIWTGMPPLEQLLDIPDPQIHTEVDFEAERTRVEGTAGITIRVGTLLAVGFGTAIPALRWFLRFLRRHRKRKSAPVAEESGTGAA